MQVSSMMGNLPSTLGLWLLKLFAMYTTDGQTDKINAYCPLPYWRVHNNHNPNTDLHASHNAIIKLTGRNPKP